MSRAHFTGERLHDRDDLFAADLARHKAAYRYAAARLGLGPGSRVGLDLGSGSGHGSRQLRRAGAPVVGLDRALPDGADSGSCRDRARFVRGDLLALPFRSASFGWLVSFQVIEHLEDPLPYLREARRVLAPGGTALVTTPNRLTSDGLNPFHRHEYTGAELDALLTRIFARVELLGVSTSAAADAFLAARNHHVARLLRLDPLRLRDRLPRRLVERLFGLLAVVVRRRVRAGGAPSRLDVDDFPIGPHDDGCLDLLAICRAES